jgi:hypothetical protein
LEAQDAPEDKTMKLHPPFQISARLLPALRIGDAWLHLEYSDRPGNGGRDRFHWTIDLPGGQEFSDDDLQSGVQGGTLQETFGSLLAFLGAAAESYEWRMREGGSEPDPDGSEHLFPPAVVEWAYQNDDEISLLRLEIEESEHPLIEE